MATGTDPATPPTVANPYAAAPPGSVVRPISPAPMPNSRGHWVWVDGPRQWAGFDIPLARDPLFWVWAFFMSASTASTIATQMNTGVLPSILVVTWVCVSAIWWFVPATARQVWRTRKKRRQPLTVDRYPVD